MGLYIFGGDIKTAFDDLSPAIVSNAMEFWKTPALIAAALLEELCDTTCWPRLGDVECDEPVPFNKCIRQGGVESPKLWNFSMRSLFAPLVLTWVERGFGIPLEHGRLTHLLWADNVYLVAREFRIFRSWRQS